MFGPYLAPLGVLAAVPLYALAAQRYLHVHAIDPADVAELAVRLRANAAENPRAELRAPLTIDDVLASRMVAPPIHKLEDAPWSDGARPVPAAPRSRRKPDESASRAACRRELPSRQPPVELLGGRVALAIEVLARRLASVDLPARESPRVHDSGDGAALRCAGFAGSRGGGPRGRPRSRAPRSTRSRPCRRSR